MAEILRELIGLVLHRYVRDGDRIRLYDANGAFITETWAKIEGWGAYAAVRLRDGNPYTAIRRDLFRWSERFCCWSYQYDE